VEHSSKLVMGSVVNTTVTQVFDLFPHASDITPEGNRSLPDHQRVSNLRLQKKQDTNKKYD